MCTHKYTCVYIYIYIYRERERDRYRYRYISHGARETTCTPNLPTNIPPTNIARLKLSGKFPMGLKIPPLKIKITPESNKPSEIHNVSTRIGRTSFWCAQVVRSANSCFVITVLRSRDSRHRVSGTCKQGTLQVAGGHGSGGACFFYV